MISEPIGKALTYDEMSGRTKLPQLLKYACQNNPESTCE
jgi:hypothetical protein